jgi:hypothetical protein
MKNIGPKSNGSKMSNPQRQNTGSSAVKTNAAKGSSEGKDFEAKL